MPNLHLNNGIPNPRPKQPLSRGIKLSKEAKSALKRIGPSDSRLESILNGISIGTMATTTEVRWMAAFILENNGYTLEGK